MSHFVSEVQKHQDAGLKHLTELKEFIYSQYDAIPINKKIEFAPFENILKNYGLENSKYDEYTNISQTFKKDRTQIIIESTEIKIIGQKPERYLSEIHNYVHQNKQDAMKLLKVYESQKILGLYLEVKNIINQQRKGRMKSHYGEYKIVHDLLTVKLQEISNFRKNVEKLSNGKPIWVEVSPRIWNRCKFTKPFNQLSFDIKQITKHSPNTSYIKVSNIIDLDKGFTWVSTTGGLVE